MHGREGSLHLLVVEKIFNEVLSVHQAESLVESVLSHVQVFSHLNAPLEETVSVFLLDPVGEVFGVVSHMSEFKSFCGLSGNRARASFANLHLKF
jgi:hypothetical protein